MTLNLDAIMAMERIERLNLINSISGFKSANLIGTRNAGGQENLTVFSSVFHLGSNPPVLGCIVRPDVVPRHTLANIRETRFYTVNHIHESFHEKAHQTSAKYPKEVSEFDAVGLTPEYVESFVAPFVSEATVKLGLEITEEIPVKTNGTIMLVGTIRVAVFPDSIKSEDGTLEIEKAGTVAISGLNTYHSTRCLNKLGYARI